MKFTVLPNFCIHLACLLSLLLPAATFGGSFARWQEDNFTEAERADANLSGPLAMPAGDGFPNLIKYAMGAAPEESIVSLIQLGDENHAVRFEYFRDPDLEDVELRLETCADLESWSTVEAGDARLTTTLLDSGIELICFAPTDGETGILVRLVAASAKPSRMPIGTNFWNFAWGNGRNDYFLNDLDWATVENPWRPSFLEDISIYSVIRFMDQVPTNSSTVRNWSERVKKTDNHYTTDRGAVAYEWQIDLCNRIGADIWITVPHLTIESYEEDPADNYWTKLAQLLKEDLDPKLNIYIEYSNESWSNGSSFRQGDYTGERGTEMGFDSQAYTSKFYFHVYAAMRLHKVFIDAFPGERHRLKTVVSGQANSHWGTLQIVKALGNKNNSGPDMRLNPDNLIPDYFAISNYISTANAGSETIRTDWTIELAEKEANYIQHLETITPAGMRLISYEGGQHYTTNAHLFSRNPESYDMYQEWLEMVSQYFDLTMHYTHTGRWASGGAWGAKDSTDQDISEAHRYRALVDWVNGSE